MAGLPNITGTLGYQKEGSMYVDGCIYYSGDKARCGSFDGTLSTTPARFDASRSSAIYGNSSTVQPPAIKVRVKTRYQ